MLGLFFDLNMDGTCFSETSVNFQQTALPYVTGDGTFHMWQYRQNVTAKYEGTVELVP
jgi:hypothetical protein